MGRNTFSPLIYLLIVLILYCNSGIAGLRETDKFREVEDFLTISREMKQFLDEHIMEKSGTGERLQALIDAIFDKRLLDFQYTGNRTLTAAETFRSRSGNCLSFTAMFIVMARHAGLKASFQEVYHYSSWTKRQNIVIFNRHIDALVQAGGKHIEVDFSFSSDKKLRSAGTISDNRARAHYLNNIGAEALLQKDNQRAESLFNRAIGLDDGFAPAWINLGLLHQFSGKPSQAEQAYRRAISLGDDTTAHVNLANLYEAQGEEEKAAGIWKQIKRLRRKNPYYHYSLGQEAFAAGNFKEANIHFKRAINRNPREAEFYVRLAAVCFRLGDHPAAVRYIKKARHWARSPAELNRYDRKLNYLYSHH